MSYWSENETAVEEVCANCRETLEDHGTHGCECRHAHFAVTNDQGGHPLWTLRCDGGCDPHPYERETRELCPNGSGEVFRRREPNDGY